MHPATPSSGAPVFTDIDAPPVSTEAPAATLPRFPLGRLLATPRALIKLTEFGISPLALVMRHATGDWGDLDDHDCHINELAVVHGDRILSSYLLRRTETGQVIETRLWILTEADRAVTVILLPSEY